VEARRRLVATGRGCVKYTGTLLLAEVLDDGVARDLFLNFEAGADATYLLDYFWLRAHRGTD
jgi:hypothetical protein